MLEWPRTQNEALFTAVFSSHFHPLVASQFSETIFRRCPLMMTYELLIKTQLNSFKLSTFAQIVVWVLVIQSCNGVYYA